MSKTWDRFGRMRWSTATCGREGQCMQPYALLGTPFRWVCATAGDLALCSTLDRTKNCLTIELRKLVTRSNLGVFLKNFKKAFSCVALPVFKNRHRNLQKIHPAIPSFDVKSISSMTSDDFSDVYKYSGLQALFITVFQTSVDLLCKKNHI